MDVCDLAIERIRLSLRPGVTENQVWSLLHETNIAHDGEWIECRLLASGERTNPWFQESSNRAIEPGDIVSFDTGRAMLKNVLVPNRRLGADRHRPRR
jgi:Xaa-Pro aminopeptidase